MGRSKRPERSGAIALAVALACVALATAARAQDDPVQTVTDIQNQALGQAADPGQTCASQVQVPGREGLGCDTHTTPSTNDGEEIGWSQVSGEIYPGERPSGYADFYKQKGSPIPATVDLYTVSFFSTDLGLAGGAQCEEDPPAPQEDESNAAYQQRIAPFLHDCRRVPVIYRYYRPPGDFPRWERVYRSKEPGYVGAIAWLEHDESPPSPLAVGGTGCYPRREDPWSCPGQSGPPAGSLDPIAGMGRVWLARESPDQWRERDRPEATITTPQGPKLVEMTGMNTLDASSRNIDCANTTSECAAAGGLRQIWMWSDGDFVAEPVMPEHMGEDAAGNNYTAPSWLYRVRTLRFRPPGADIKGAEAFTAGCCDAGVSSDGSPPERDPAREKPIALQLRSGAWGVELAHLPRSQPNSVWDSRAPDARVHIPDSIYAYASGSGSYLASPGGPYRAGESGPFIKGAKTTLTNGTPVTVEGASPILTDARLVAGDGDFLGRRRSIGERTHKQVHPAAVPRPDGPDGWMDWAVGGIRSTDQAVAYTTTRDTALPDPPDPLVCPEFTGSPDGDAVQALNCRPNEAAGEQTRSGAWFRLSSYFLNAFTYPAELSGVGWGVGDRGAVMRFAGEGTSGAAGTLPPEQPPTIGSKRPAPAPERSPYEPAEPTLAGEPGAVPARDALPGDDLPEPRLVAYGAPNPSGGEVNDAGLSQIAMSRDGEEGWAVGSRPFVSESVSFTTLFRFDGVRWRRCGTRGLQGSVRADPACKALRPLADLNSGRGIRISAIARVPLEYDSDPANDDEFEAIAVTTPSPLVKNAQNNLAAVLRYRDGRWRVEEGETRDLNTGDTVTDIAFSRPGEGWIVSEGVVYRNPVLNRFDGEQPEGERWMRCGTRPELGEVDCEPGGDLLPYVDAVWGGGGLRLTAAGDRVYLYGTRTVATGQGTIDTLDAGSVYPYVLFKDPDEPWRAAHNPKQDDPDNAAEQGHLYSLSVARGPDGSYNGWGVGALGGSVVGNGVAQTNGAKVLETEGETAFLHSAPDGESFARAPTTGAARDYLLLPSVDEFGYDLTSAKVVALPGPRGEGPAFVARALHGLARPIVWFDPVGERWRTFSVPWVQVPGAGIGPDLANARGSLEALAPDNAGGLWLAAGRYGHPAQWFYRYTDRASPEVFEDVSHPVRERITAAAGGADGSFWTATATNALYRYDRLTGWDRIAIPNWDRGRVVTNPSPATAIAIGADGRGVVVGKAGRIAEVGPGGAVLDQAAGILCSAQANAAPCGSGYTLRAAAVSPQGSAMVGGENRSLLWRSETGEFHQVNPPKTAVYSTITGISLPSDERAWLVTDTGEAWGGTLAGDDWEWTLENDDEVGKLDTRNEFRQVQSLRAVAVDVSGHGYAVGDEGTILERASEGDLPWRRLDAGHLDDLDSVTLGPGGKGALIGGENGLLLTEAGRGAFAPVRPAELLHPTVMGTQSAGVHSARVVGLALLPGYTPGQIEAWAVSQVPSTADYRQPPPGVLLHHSSDRSEPLLDGGTGRSDALADAPPPLAGALSFAAFGKSDCRFPGTRDAEPCPEMTGSSLTGETIARRVRDEVIAASREPGGPEFALFTGDAGDVASGRSAHRLTHPLSEGVVLNRWAEQIAVPLGEAGVPLFGALGARDLSSHVHACPLIQNRGGPPFVCWGPESPDTHAFKTGPNLIWRKAMAGMPAPWGSGTEAASRSGLGFEPVGSSGLKVEPPEYLALADPGGGGEARVPVGGARTHYAFDVVRDGKPLLRVAVLDTSLRSLSASDAQQNPVERQLEWLREVLSSRPEGERAAVLTTTPTYSYNPGPEALTETTQDGTVLEGLLREQGVDAVVAGRLGWNALYWALAPGLHYPCPGGGYPENPNQPPSGVPSCDEAGSTPPDQAVAEAQKAIADQGAGSPTPFVVASSAGGKFSRDAEESGRDDAEQGFWHGYSVLHLDPDSGELRVDQRPVLDWLSISGATHVLRAGRRLRLRAEGREPLGLETGARYDAVSTPAITHRFELLAADPDKPWIPKRDEGSADNASEYRSPASEELEEEDPCGPYLCLASSVGTIDDQSGEVRAGKGSYARTFAIAQLSVGERTATYPLVFEPRASFREPTRTLPSPVLPPPPSAPKQPPVPNTPSVEPPQPPPVPPIEHPLSINPVIPPTPPAYGNASPIDLGIAPVAIVAPPPAVVLQPPNPVVQPAPPSGARREARQRQAASQKSGAGAAESGREAADPGDLADGPASPGGSDMTRHEFTAIARDEPVSAWARDALIGGGLGITALVLALGLGTARPTPRRRPPDVPAPAYSRARRSR